MHFFLYVQYLTVKDNAAIVTHVVEGTAARAPVHEILASVAMTTDRLYPTQPYVFASLTNHGNFSYREKVFRNLLCLLRRGNIAAPRKMFQEEGSTS